MKRNVFIEVFLLRNEFTQVKENTFTNDKCTVILLEDCYQIDFNDPDHGDVSSYTTSESIYHLIGILTWYDLMDRNYKK
jgi:hypothetical protein